MYSETLWPESYDCNALYTLIEGPWKYIQSRRPELYDLGRDPGERDNRIDKEPAVARGLRADLEDLRKKMPAAAGSPGGASALVDQETLRRLESLGYIGGGVERERLGPDAGREDPKDFVALFERLKTASQLVREQRDQEAEQILLDLVAQRPRLVLARNALAEIALGHSRPGDAIKHLSAALSALAEAKETAAPMSRKNTALLSHHLHELLARAGDGSKAGPGDRRVADRRKPRSRRQRRVGTDRAFGLSAAVPGGGCRVWKGVGDRPPKRGAAEQAGLDVGHLPGGVGPRRRQSTRNRPAAGRGLRPPRAAESRHLGRRLRRGRSIRQGRGRGGRGLGPGPVRPPGAPCAGGSGAAWTRIAPAARTGRCSA